MYNQLLSLMQMPEAYQPNLHPFWDDEHISAHMLAAHLNPDQAAASRTHAFMDTSADWITQIAPPQAYSRLLDLGCGPGLYAQRFAKRGYQVTGVDLSRRSIQYAREQANDGNIRYYLCDYCQLELNETFDLVTLIYCDFGVLCPADRHKVLCRSYDHLRPGGRMLLDVFSQTHEKAFKPYQRWEHCPQGGFWRKEPYIAMEESKLYPDHVIGQQIHIITENSVTPYYLWNTCFTQERLSAEAEAAGFHTIGFFGDVAGADYANDGDILTILLEK